MSKACAIAELSRRAGYRDDPFERQLVADQPIIDTLSAVVEQHARWGIWKCFYRLRNLGRPWNHKRVWRVYTQMRLNQKRRTKKRLPERTPAPLDIPAQLNHDWSFDFMSDSLYSGQRYRMLNNLDEGVREALDIVIDTSITAQRVVRTLEQIALERGFPSVIRIDNGSEITAHVFTDWCDAHHIRIVYIQPGKPNQNTYIERFNRSFREEVLNPHVFGNLNEVPGISWAWHLSYNEEEERPHQSLDNIPPAEFKRQLDAETSSSELSA